MRIQHNIAAQFAYRNLTISNNRLNKNMEKLSSGYRINRAADDAAGLAISEKMRTQINGFKQANKNVQDGISAYQVAEGGLENIQSMLHRMRTLAVQSANDTVTNSDRALIQLEVTQLICEIDRTISGCEFNTKKLLMPQPVNVAAGGLVAAGTEALVKTDTPAAGGGNFPIDLDAFGITATQKVRIVIAADSANVLTIGDVDISGIRPDSHSNIIGNFIGPNALYDGAGGATGGGNNGPNIANCEITLDWNTIQNTDGGVGADLNINGIVSSGNIQYWVYATQAATGGAADQNPNDDLETLHIGPNKNQTIDFNKPDLSNDRLGIDSLSVSTSASAEAAISTLDSAITTISSSRATIGASINRLEHTYNFNGIAAENTQAAESRIRDVDFAAEMIEFTKNQIITQASQSMLSQANLQPQSILQLFG